MAPKKNQNAAKPASERSIAVSLRLAPGENRLLELFGELAQGSTNAGMHALYAHLSAGCDVLRIADDRWLGQYVIHGQSRALSCSAAEPTRERAIARAIFERMMSQAEE